MYVKDFIIKFVESFKDDSRSIVGWRPAGQHLGIDHQKLLYRVKAAEKMNDIFGHLEAMRKRLGLTKAQSWDLLAGVHNKKEVKITPKKIVK